MKSATISSRILRRAKVLLVQTFVGKKQGGRRKVGRCFLIRSGICEVPVIYWACYFRDTPLSEHFCVTASSNYYPNVIL